MPSSAAAPAIDPKSFLETSLPDIVAGVRSVCHLYHIENDLIDDMCQQIALLLIEDDYRRLRSFDHQKACFKTWLITVVKNHVLNELRKKQITELPEWDGGQTSVYPTQEMKIISRELQDGLRATIGRLSKRDQELAQLAFEEDLSAPEIASLMGIKIESVYRRKHAIAKRLSLALDG
jgi:RNA polymerase sigma factor (sigma-70 family)